MDTTLVLALAAQLQLHDLPPAETPQVEHPQPARVATPVTYDVRKLQSLRARFAFARDTANKASMDAVDTELAALLPAPGAQPSKPFEKDPAPSLEAMAFELSRVRGKLDAESLKSRARIIELLLARAQTRAP